jgi:hypothetical protein
MSVRQEEESAIARAVAAELAGRLQDLLDFIRSEILTLASGGVGEPGRGDTWARAPWRSLL